MATARTRRGLWHSVAVAGEADGWPVLPISEAVSRNTEAWMGHLHLLWFISILYHIHIHINIQVQDPAHGLDPISSVTIDTNTFSKRRTFDLININTVALFVDFILEFQQRFLQLAVTFSSLTSNIECKGNGSGNENATSAVIATPLTWTSPASSLLMISRRFLCSLARWSSTSSWQYSAPGRSRLWSGETWR